MEIANYTLLSCPDIVMYREVKYDSAPNNFPQFRHD